MTKKRHKYSIADAWAPTPVFIKWLKSLVVADASRQGAIKHQNRNRNKHLSL